MVLHEFDCLCTMVIDELLFFLILIVLSGLALFVLIVMAGCSLHVFRVLECDCLSLILFDSCLIVLCGC